MRYGNPQPKDVLVYDVHGRRIENTTHSKARKMLEGKKARIYNMTPFSIQMLVVTSNKPPVKEAVGE